MKREKKRTLDLHHYVVLFVKACERYNFKPNEEGEFVLTKAQKDRVDKYIRSNCASV